MLASVAPVGSDLATSNSDAGRRSITLIRSSAVCLLIGSLWAAGPGWAEDLPVDLELVLAVDVSGSIDAEEARQQREGYVAAITDPAVIQAIRANFHQRIAVAYVEWASSDYQRVVIEWTVIEDAGERRRVRRGACGVSGRFQRAGPRSAVPSTSPLRCSTDNGYAGERRVIDISGDGPNNRGRSVTMARDEAVAQGIVINGLPILNDRRQPFDLPTPVELALDEYYTRQRHRRGRLVRDPCPGLSATSGTRS